MTAAIEASARAKRFEHVALTAAEMDAVLTILGFVAIGPDPDDRHFTLWQQPGRSLYMSLPAVASGPDIARTIWHAGAHEARRQIREARDRYLATLA